MQISQGALKEALTEIEALRREKARDTGWPDALYDFVVTALGDTCSRKRDRITYNDLALILNKRGWWNGTGGEALAQAVRKERNRRQRLTEGE